MVWIRTFQLGIKNLLLHPMRSMLTMLGILIGVFSVITLLAIGDGISEQAQKQIEDLGAENIMIRTIKPPSEAGANFREIKMYGITRAEQRLIERTIPTIKNVIPIRELPMKFSYQGNPNVKPIDGRLVGCTSDYQSVNRLEMARGHFLTPREVERKLPVCVIAGVLADKLFPSEDPIKKQIFMPEKGQFYEIVGVLKYRDATAAIGGSLAAQDFSYDVYIPITAMESRMGDQEVKRASGSFSVDHFELSQLTVQVADIKNIQEISDLVKNTLLRDKPLRQDFAIIVPYELIKRAEATRQVFLIFLAVIAGISLLVGGIGIMNIMLATVTERTREIGIRRALGAKQGDIVRQFLVETVVLSIFGGIIGIVLGCLATFLVVPIRDRLAYFRPDIFEGLPPEIQNMTPNIVLMSVPISFGISVAVGIVFGLYPAIRAAKMDPIEALRHE
ncbi:MAG TPA: ABC transporter permease [Pirellulaceae bacterium]|nr:ABC transporter permease [Pirellulaceae bacterium]HMO92305.1 ABC transporter permease [Pirellulaceae bacterium]HMP69229.1 ABC transporter permease [Pirellulaceae bacterium]